MQREKLLAMVGPGIEAPDLLIMDQEEALIKANQIQKFFKTANMVNNSYQARKKAFRQGVIFWLKENGVEESEFSAERIAPYTIIKICFLFKLKGVQNPLELDKELMQSMIDIHQLTTPPMLHFN